MHYKKYNQKIIYQVSKSGNPNLFPNLKIPRTTATYWIKQKMHLDKRFKPKDGRITQIQILRDRLNKCQEENRNLRAQINILRTYIKLLNKNKLIKLIKDNSVQKQITLVIKRYRNKNSVRSVLEQLNISFSKYKRWCSNKVSTSNYSFSQSTCRSITYLEVMKIKNYYLSSDLFFYSLQSLCTKAKINSEVYACPKTWSQYIKELKLKRPFSIKIKPKRYPLGIQASSPHELWHIDVTEIKVAKKKVYIQVIKDNFTRMILGWHRIDKISAQNTLKLLKETISEYDIPSKIMSDAGKENCNHLIKAYLKDKRIKHYIAKLNTRYSNSRVETYFRMIKTNYLKKLKLLCVNELLKHFEFYTHQYNYEIPHSALDFRTPKEVMDGLTQDHYREKFNDLRAKTIEMRIKSYNS